MYSKFEPLFIKSDLVWLVPESDIQSMTAHILKHARHPDSPLMSRPSIPAFYFDVVILGLTHKIARLD